jgi:hypothetical protein
MTPDEAIQLLAHAAAFDNRKPSAVAAKAWAAALHDVPLDEDALAAVARYYGLSTTTDDGPRWIQPHHVRAHRLALRDERGHVPGPGLPPEIPAADPDDVPGYLAALREQRTRAASGHSVPALAAGDSDPADNPAARKVREMFDAAQTEARRRKAEEARAASEALRLYRAAVEHVLALPDHGGDAMRWAREELLGDDQAAQGFPLLAQVPGVTDDHKVTIRAALATGMTESEAS